MLVPSITPILMMVAISPYLKNHKSMLWGALVLMVLLAVVSNMIYRRLHSMCEELREDVDYLKRHVPPNLVDEE
jgi:cytochrome c-type biogenesis protein CcmH/NrfF